MAFEAGRLEPTDSFHKETIKQSLALDASDRFSVESTRRATFPFSLVCMWRQPTAGGRAPAEEAHHPTRYTESSGHLAGFGSYWLDGPWTNL